MPQSSVEIVRGHIEAYRAQDTPRAVSFLSPHVVWDGSRTGALEPSDVMYGVDALTEFVRRYRGTFAGYDYEVTSLQELGPGMVLAAVTEVGSGRTSGVPVSRATAVLYTVIEGKIVRITVFPTEEAARKAVSSDEGASL